MTIAPCGVLECRNPSTEWAKRGQFGQWRVCAEHSDVEHDGRLLRSRPDAYRGSAGTYSPCGVHPHCEASEGHDGPCSVPAWSDVWSRP